MARNVLRVGRGPDDQFALRQGVPSARQKDHELIRRDARRRHQGVEPAVHRQVGGPERIARS